jgi:hypothetical protein
MGGRRRRRGRSRSRSRSGGRLLLAIALVIGLAEQIVVLLDVKVPGERRARSNISRALATRLLLQRDSQVVERLRVVGVELHRALEPEACLAPEPAPGDFDAETELFLGGGGRLAGRRGKQDDEERQHRNHERSPEPG